VSENNGKQDPPKFPFAIVSRHKINETMYGPRLLVAFQLQGPQQVPLSHMIEVPGEVLPMIIKSLQELVAEFPALTTDLCVPGETTVIAEEKPSGLVDAEGKPVKGKAH